MDPIWRGRPTCETRTRIASCLRGGRDRCQCHHAYGTRQDRGDQHCQGRLVQLLASGVGVPWALEAQELLKQDWGVAADVWSVTSWNELRRDGLACDKEAYLHPEREARVPWVTQKLTGTQGPVVAVSDWMRAVQDQIREWVPGDFGSLGADGFGFSDTRPAARRYFHIDGPSMAAKALHLGDRAVQELEDLQIR